MINERIAEALNQQINNEMYSSYLYFALSIYAQELGYKGTGHWFEVQMQEEQLHTQKFCNYLLSQGASVSLKSIEEPPVLPDTMLGMFEKTLEHEQTVTRCIAELAAIAREEKDYASEVFLQWFVTEQVEEEESVGDIISQIKLAGDGGGLFMIDRELGQRVFTPTAP